MQYTILFHIKSYEIINFMIFYSRNNTFGFTIGASDSYEAEGELYWDDGITDVPTSEVFHMFISLSGVS